MSGRQQKNSFVKVLLRSISLELKAVPLHNIIAFVILMIQGVLYASSVYVTQGLFDTVTDAANGKLGFTACLLPLVLLTGVTLGQQIINGVHHLQFDFLFGKSRCAVNSTLHQKLQRIDPSCFEDTEFLDDLNKAKEGVHALPYFANIVFMILFFYGFYFVTLGVYLYNLKPMLLITLVLAFIPALLAQFARAKIFTRLEDDSAPIRREYEYYQKALCDREYFKETRILGAFGYFHSLFKDTMLLLTRKVWHARRRSELIRLVLNTSTFAGMAVVSYLLFTATMSGEITVGAFAAVFSALGLLFQMMQEIVNVHIGNMNEDVGKMANLIRILDFPERARAEDGEFDFSKGVSAQAVSYTYPGRNAPAVKNVSFAVGSGETIAIVGENGAGKSTLARLLAGVYAPSAGKVLIGGREITAASPQTAYTGISAVFQKYQKYKMTLGENVTISDVGREAVPSKIGKALQEADFDCTGMDYDTVLSPEFDGVDLSGGQWQRLAIARGLYRANGFILLDEPTAAIDPVMEAAIYRKFQQMAEGKCAVLVTHRLGAAKLAHRIIVMDNGEIADSGTHEELLSRPGKYAEMWAAQAKWYQREPEDAPLST